MAEHMIITDLTALQMYGLIHLSIMIWVFIGSGYFWALPHIKQTSGKIMFWIAGAILIFLPAYFGLTAIAPALPAF